MICCVLLPVFIQNSWNFFFTHPGKQFFYETCESILLTSFLAFMMTFDVYKKIIKIELEKLTKSFQVDDEDGQDKLGAVFDSDHKKRKLDSENPYDMFTS